MSLWADYIREFRGEAYMTFLEYPNCFVAYSMPEGECILIHDIYVKPEFRKAGCGKALLSDVEKIGLEAGRKYVLTEIEVGTPLTEVSIKAQLKVGFLPVAAQNGIIVMRKEITHG